MYELFKAFIVVFVLVGHGIQPLTLRAQRLQGCPSDTACGALFAVTAVTAVTDWGLGDSK